MKEKTHYVIMKYPCDKQCGRDKEMKKAFAFYNWLLAGATIGVCLLFIWQIADILRAGADAAQMYTYEDMAHRLQALRVPLFLYAGLCAAGLIWRAFLPMKENGKGKGSDCTKEYRQPSARLRTALYVLAAALIVLGVMNGGLWDVLVKAINICTECIGLG